MKIACVVMAAGASTRFGESKLTKLFCSRPMFEYALDALPGDKLWRVAVVSGKKEILDEAEKRGFISVLNDKPEEGPPRTIRLGLEALDGADAAMFMVADQPLLTRCSVSLEIEHFIKHSDNIVAMGKGDRRGNHVIFPKCYFAELSTLKGERGGGAVMARHEDKLILYQLENEAELMDIDTAEDWIKLERQEKDGVQGNKGNDNNG